MPRRDRRRIDFFYARSPVEPIALESAMRVDVVLVATMTRCTPTKAFNLASCGNQPKTASRVGISTGAWKISEEIVPLK